MADDGFPGTRRNDWGRPLALGLLIACRGREGARPHLNRYVQEFVARNNMRELDTLQKMALIAKRMENAQLRYRELVG